MESRDGGLFFRIGIDTSNFNDALEKIKAHLQQVAESARNSGASVEDAVNKEAETLSAELQKSLGDVDRLVAESQKAVEEAIKSGNKGAIESSRQALANHQALQAQMKNTMQGLGGVATSVINQYKPLDSMFGQILSKLGVSDAAIKAMGGGATKAFGMIKTSLAGLRTGMKATEVAGKLMWAGLTLGIALLLPLILDFMKRLKGIADRSEGFRKIGAGLEVVFKLLGEALAKVSSTLAGTLTKGIDLVTRGFGKLFDGITALVGLINKDWADSMRKSMQNLGNEVEAQFKRMELARFNAIRDAKDAYDDAVAYEEIYTKEQKIRNKNLSTKERAGLFDSIRGNIAGIKQRGIDTLEQDNYEYRTRTDAEIAQGGKATEYELILQRMGKTNEEYNKATSNEIAEWKATANLSEKEIETLAKHTDYLKEKQELNVKFARQLERYNRQEQDLIKEEQEALADARKEREELKRQADKFNADTAKLEQQGDYFQQEQEINLTKVGISKKIALAELKYQKQRDALDAEVEARKDALREFDKSQGKSLQDDEYYQNLAEQQLSYSYKLADINKKSLDELQKYRNEYLEKWGDFLQKKQQLISKQQEQEKEFTEGHNDIIANGGTDEGYDAKLQELREKNDAQIEELAVQFAQKSEEFLLWSESLAGTAIMQLKLMLTQAETELAKLEPTADNHLAVAKVATLKQAVKDAEKAQRDANRQTDQSTLKLEKQGKAIQNTKKAWAIACDALDFFTESMSDEDKKVLNFVKDITNTALKLMDTIFGVAQSSLQALESASVATAESIKNAERASVILAIIQAALEVVQAMFKLFSHQEKITDEVIEAHNKEIDAMDAVIEKNREMIEERKRYSTQLADLYKKEGESYQLRQNAELTFLGELAKDRRRGENSWQYKLNEGGSNYTIRAGYNEIANKVNKDIADKLLASSANYAGIAKVFTEMSEMEFLQIKTTTWWSRFASDATEYTATLERMHEAAIAEKEFQKTINEAERGFSQIEVEDGLLDYMLDFNSSIDDAKSNFQDLMKIIMRKGLLANLSKEMGAFMDKMDAYLDSGGEIDATEMQELERMYEELAEKGKQRAEAMGAFFNEQNADTAEAKGIATASQESVDENNGHLTQIQAHTYQLATDMTTLTQNSTDILNNVILIAGCSAEIQRLTQHLQNDVSYMRTNGIMLN